MYKRIILSLVVIALIATLAVTLVSCNNAVSPDAEIRYFNSDDRDGDSDRLRVGILSDTQLAGSDEEMEGAEDKLYYANLVNTLTAFKEQGAEMILMAGDIMDGDEKKENLGYGYDLYLKAFKSVYPTDPPITAYIMGNHDYWFDGNHGSRQDKQELFSSKFGVNPFTHYVVNGYHFINWSPDENTDTSSYSKEYAELLEKEIEKAEEDTAGTGAPIFVMTHQNPTGTVVGSDDWGDPDLAAALEGHERVINFSGHSHYSMLDERSIWQGSYTAFTTQSIAYVDGDGTLFDGASGKNVSVPPRADARPMAIVMDIYRDRVDIKRINVMEKDDNGKLGKEELADNRWSVKVPVKKENFTYTDSARADRAVPVFAEDATISATDKAPVYNYMDMSPISYTHGITFHAADNYNNGNKSYVYSYSVKFERDGSAVSYEYWSDFYLGMSGESARGTVTLAIPEDMAHGEYTVTIRARDFFGGYSAPIVGKVTL